MKKFEGAQLVELAISETQSGGSTFKKADSEVYDTIVDGKAVSYYTYYPEEVLS